MRKAPRCTWKNFPGAPFWICRNLRLGYSSLILGWIPKAMTRRAPALRVNYSTKVYVTRQGGQEIDNLTSEFWTMWKFCTIAYCQTDAPQIKKYNIWWLIKPRRLGYGNLTVKTWNQGRWWETDFDIFPKSSLIFNKIGSRFDLDQLLSRFSNKIMVQSTLWCKNGKATSGEIWSFWNLSVKIRLRAWNSYLNKNLFEFSLKFYLNIC